MARGTVTICGARDVFSLVGSGGTKERELNSEFIFRVIFFAVFVLLLVVRVYYGLKARRAGQGGWAVQEEAIEREGWGIILLRLVAIPCILAALVLYVVNPPWLGALAIPFPAWARWIGVGLAVLSISLLVWVHHTLGKHWSTSLQMQEGHTLVTSGPYRWVRHPMYAVLFGFFVGVLLISAFWPVAPLVVVSILMLYARLDEEEAMMIEQFGDVYRAYMQRTGRLLPRLIHRSD
jgi:protein-S-isoprenylcysteine O-methyltransferase Ste14